MMAESSSVANAVRSVVKPIKSAYELLSGKRSGDSVPPLPVLPELNGDTPRWAAESRYSTKPLPSLPTNFDSGAPFPPIDSAALQYPPISPYGTPPMRIPTPVQVRESERYSDPFADPFEHDLLLNVDVMTETPDTIVVLASPPTPMASRPDSAREHERIGNPVTEHSYPWKTATPEMPQSAIPTVDERVPYTISTVESDQGSARIWSSTGRDLEATTQSTEYTRDSSVLTKSQQLTYQHDVQPLGLYTAPTLYSASEASDSLSQRNKGYIVDLASELFSAVNTAELGKEKLSRISEMLPDLLRAFALQLGHHATGQIHRDVSFFVHKYRRQVQDAFNALSPFESDVSPAADEVQPGEFAIGRFLQEPETALEPPEESQESYEDESIIISTVYEEGQGYHENESDTESTMNEDSVIETDVGLYRNFIKTTSAYQWLVASLQKESILTRSTPDIMETVKESILGALPSAHKVSKQAPPQAYRVTFELAWEPLNFLRKQKYAETPDIAIQRAITFTGRENDAQATTTREYLEQTWPVSGAHIMQLVADVVSNNTEHGVIFSKSGGIELRAQTSGSKFIVTATGTGDSVAETGQQLAWLGAALRFSPSESKVTTCSPFIKSTSLKPSATPAIAGQLPLIELHCEIDFKIEAVFADGGVTNSGEDATGRCWHDMFFKPLIVSGYPILTKSKHRLGTEMSLNMLAEFTGSYRAVEFNNTVYIKGFSTMAVAKKVIGDLVIWHYLYNSEEKRISYLDDTQEDSEAISLLQLHTARHVVGWTEDCKYYAGAVDAEYDIDGSNLPQPHAGALLDRVTISGGKFVSGGVSIAVGVKNVPQHLTRKGYIPQLRWIHKKFVILWDEEDKRGWLVNGTSALLHLVRASLRSYKKDLFSSKLRFKEDQMHYSVQYEATSAVEVLINDHNRELEVWPGNIEISEEEEVKTKRGESDAEVSKAQKRKRGFILFQDLVEEKFTRLEQVMEYQTLRAGQNGYNLKTRVRKHLEGWDFRDLADDLDPRPRVATLSALGYGWVDFIRSMEAVTLFGCGFGNIIQPLKPQEICPRWQNLPEGGFHLAVSIFDLQTITRYHGNWGENEIELVPGLISHSPGNTYTSCHCQDVHENSKKPIKGHYEPVQGLYPKWSSFLSQPTKPIKVPSAGAVIFGHTASGPYRRKDESRGEHKQGVELERSLLETSRQLAVPGTDHSEPLELESSNDNIPPTDQSSQSRDHTDEEQPHSLWFDQTTLTLLASLSDSISRNADVNPSTNENATASKDRRPDEQQNINQTPLKIPRTTLGEKNMAEQGQILYRQAQSEVAEISSRRAHPTTLIEPIHAPRSQVLKIPRKPIGGKKMAEQGRVPNQQVQCEIGGTSDQRVRATERTEEPNRLADMQTWQKFKKLLRRGKRYT